jgi:hypothetical protein
MAGNWIGDEECRENITELSIQSNLARRDTGIRKIKHNGIEHITNSCLASELYLVITADGEVFGCCCLRGIKPYSFGKVDYGKGINLQSILSGEKRAKSLKSMKSVTVLNTAHTR